MNIKRIIKEEINDFEWARDVVPNVQHVKTEEYIIYGVPHTDFNTVVYNKFCKLYGKDYIDELIHDGSINIFHNPNIDIGGEEFISFIVMPYKDGGIDMCLWGYFGSDYGPQYSYTEFLNMELIDEPKP